MLPEDIFFVALTVAAFGLFAVTLGIVGFTERRWAKLHRKG